MQTSKQTDNKINKSRIQTKVKDDVSNSKGWFSNLRKSFGNRKTRITSSEDKTKEFSDKIRTKSTQEIESYDYSDTFTTPKDVQLSNFSNEFLDSFIQKSSNSYCNEDLSSKFQRYQFKNFINPKIQMQSFLNLMFSNISEHRRIIEKVLMLVVEDYINSTCEKMLHDKMRSVYKKIENWSKNPLTKPGFKKSESILGGNITKPEKSFVIESNPRSKKIENCFPNSIYQNHVSMNHEKNYCSKDVLISSSLNNRRFTKIKESKSSRISFPLDSVTNSRNYIVQKSEIGSSLKNRTLNHKEKNHKKFKTDLNSDSSRTLIEDNQNLQAVRSVIKTSEFESNVDEENVQTDEFNEQTFQNDTINSKYSILKSRGHSTCKCLKKHKTSAHCELSGQKSNNQMSNNIKGLKVYNIVNIDIKPFGKSNTHLFSRIPKHHTRLRIEKQCEANLTDKDISSKLSSMNNKDLSLNRIIRPKIRRSVTFEEPWKGVLNSPLCKDIGFCSEWEVRSEVNKSGILTSTKSEELNYLLSSNISIPDLLESHKDNLISLANQSNKSETHSAIIDDVTIITDTPLNRETKDCLSTIKDDHTIKNFSPVIISLQSTPSFVGDINYPYDVQNFVKNYTSPKSQSQKNGLNFADSFKDIKKSTKSSENINNLNFESDWNIINNQRNIPDFKTHCGSKNYSVIEIIKQSDYDQKINHHTLSTINISDKINRSTFTTQLESANSSYESTMIDEDVLITTTSTKSNISNQQVNLQEIILSDDEETFQKSKSQSKKDLFHLTKMKTANFSSSVRIQGKNSHIVNTLKSTIPFLRQSNNQKIHELKSSSLLKTGKVDSNNSTTLDLQACKKDKNSNILKHTVASKQKMRGKATIKTIQEKNPMKFSKGISRIY